MKKLLAVMIALALVFSIVVIPSFAIEDDNLLDDGTVDNDVIVTCWPNGWAAGIAQDWNEQSHTDDGSGCIILQNDNDHANQHCTQPVSLTGGETYILSGWIKLEDDFYCRCAGACGAYIAINTPNGSIPSGNYVAQAGWKDTNDVVTGTWVFFSTPYTPEEDVDTFFSLCLWGSTGTAYFDDLYIGKAGSKAAAVYLSDLEASSWVTYHQSSTDEQPYSFQPSINCQEAANANGNTHILIKGQEYYKGIQVHASDEERHKIDGQPAAYITYDISAYNYDMFKCVFGGLSKVGESTVSEGHYNATRIEVDGNVLFESDFIDITDIVEIAVKIPTDAKEIKLISLAGEEFNSEWYAWADAQLCYAPAEKPAETATPEPTPTPTPEPTATPEPSDEPTTEPSADPTAAPSAEPKSSGCGSVVIESAAVMTLAIAGVAVILSKKRKH